MAARTQMRTFTSLLAGRSLPTTAGSSYSRLLQAGPSSTAFRRFLSDDTRKKIDQAVKKDPLVVFMKGTPQIPQCGFSKAVIQILDIQGVPREKLQTYNCLEDEELRQGIKEYSSWPTIPQVYVNGEFVGGCDVLLESHQKGELPALLQEAGVVEKAPESAPTENGAA